MTAARRLLPILLLGTLCSGLAVNAQQTQSQPNAPADQETTESSKPVRVRVSSGVAAGLVKKRVAPHYPQDARDQHLQGTVVMSVLISREGDVSEVKAISGHPVLAPAAMEAVKKWKYKPYLLDGRPVEVETTVQINFTLSGG